MPFDKYKNKNLINNQNYVKWKEIDINLFFKNFLWYRNDFVFYVFSLPGKIYLKYYNKKTSVLIEYLYNFFYVVILFIFFFNFLGDIIYSIFNPIFSLFLFISLYTISFIYITNTVYSILDNFKNSNFLVLWFRTDSLEQFYNDDNNFNYIVSISYQESLIINNSSRFIHKIYFVKIFILFLIFNIPLIMYFLFDYFLLK